MKLFEAFSETGYHTTVVTSFCIDFAAYEQIVLTRLREAGCMNNIVVADRRMVTQALEDGSRPPLYAGRRYSVAAANTAELFHPKLVLQLGHDCGRLLVASANLTASGLAGNLEVVGQLRMGLGEDEPVPVLQQALAYIRRFIGPEETAALQQLDWARARTPWLRQALPDFGDVRLLASGDAQGLARRFAALIGREKVARLVVVSPYWDEKLRAVQALQGLLSPRATALVLQTQAGLFPRVADLKAQLFDLQPAMGKQQRFAHAKVIIAQTNAADHVLYGSANCTFAALGDQRLAGKNEEACLYRKMPPGAALETLALDKALDAKPTPLSRIAPYRPTPAIPLEELAQKQPGHFRLQRKELTWIPVPSFDRPDAVVELLDARGENLNTTLTPAAAAAGRAFQIEATQSPAFARVRVGERVSSIAIVHAQESILEQLKVGKTKKIQEALDALDTDATEGVWLLDALELIDAEERRLALAPPRQRGGGQRRNATGAQAQSDRKLSFEEFIAARSPEMPPDLHSASSLAMSHANSVRALLNTVIGIGEERLEAVDEEPEALHLDMGDETGDGEALLEAGGEFGTDASALDSTIANGVEAGNDSGARRADTAADIARSVLRFNKSIGEAAEERELTTRDLLRFRLLMTLLMAAGANGVLRARGDVGWPRLAAQVLFRLFGHAGLPLINRVVFQPDVNGGVPADVLEGLATSFWTAAALAHAKSAGAPTELATHAERFASEMYAVAGLDSDYLQCPVITTVMNAMSTRYAAGLGLDPERVKAFHSQFATAAPQLRAARQARLTEFDERVDEEAEEES
jgi:hypothetical protein